MGVWREVRAGVGRGLGVEGVAGRAVTMEKSKAKQSL